MGNVYGLPPDWRIEGYKIDKNQAVTLEVVKPWEPILVEDGLVLTLPDIPISPIIAGFKAGSGQWKRSVGGMVISFEYEGVQPQSLGGGRGDEIGVKWNMNGSLFQKDIRTAAKWNTIRDKYLWSDKDKEFPDLLPSISKVDSPWIKTDSGVQKLNPLRATKSIDDFSGVLTKSYLSPVLPAGIFLRINRIIKKPYPALPDLGDRDWKYMCPDWDEHGDLFRIFEHLELSGPGGWNKDMYGDPLTK